MSPWWRHSSKKTRKNKANLGGVFGLIRQKLKNLSESKKKSSESRSEIASEVEFTFQVSSSILAAQSQNVDERLNSYALPVPANASGTGRVAPRSVGHSEGSSEFAFPVLNTDHARNGHDRNNAEGNLVTDSAFSDGGGECDAPSGFRRTSSPQECNYQTSTSSPSSHVITTQKKREKPKQLMNLQIPQPGGFCRAPDNSKSSPSKSPTRVVGPEPAQNDFWAMRPSADPGFLGPGPSSSPGSGCSSSQDCRRTPERGSPTPSPGPSPRIQSGPPSADPGFLGPGPSSSPGSGYNSSQNCRRTHERGSPTPSTSPRIQSGPSSVDPGFLGPGPSSSPGSGYNSSQNSRRTPEHGSPAPSPRISSSGPSPRFQSGPPSVDPVFLGPGPSSSPGSGYNSSENRRRTPERGSPTPSPRPSPRRHIRPPSANWPDDAINGNWQAHPLPLPPGAISNTGPSSPVYSHRTTPTVPRSPGRADLVVSPGSRWKKGKLLGRGAHGDVYAGFDSATGEMCAMKEVTLSADKDLLYESVQQLKRDIARVRRLKHPNIAQYYGFETVDDKLYIYLEYVGGGSIYKILQEHGAFDECVIRNYTRQILQGLVYLHSKNRVHKNIKGSNILVDANGLIKLADFGLAKHISGPSRALPLMGSSCWTAPELIGNAAKGCSFLVDIWSLGCTIHEMATTKPPWSDYTEAVALFKITNTKEIEPPNKLSDEGKDFMVRCMQRDPSNRPSAAALLDHPFVREI